MKLCFNFKKRAIYHGMYISILEKNELLITKLCFNFRKKGTIYHEMCLLIFEKKRIY